ncbi:MAG: IS1380 family transposase, partial [bacterium]|nr:IS1380 family transposase [bacterium]
PMFTARNIHYELAERSRGLGPGGIGAMHQLGRRVGLIDAIDRRLHLLKVHLPYHESDHVLNIAYNILCGGDCLEDLELRRNDEVYLDALGAQRIPDPTTEGDFCRRFDALDVEILQDTLNDVRLGVWREQPAAFFDRATIDVDGVLAETSGACKEGIGLAYNGTWGYHPLVVSLANTQEPLYLSNRSGNRPSHEGAAGYLDKAIALCRRAGFKSTLLRGDTDFSQTEQLDRWNTAGVHFVFGLNAMRNLIGKAENLPKSAWKKLRRPPKYDVKTGPRQRPTNVKEQIVVAKDYKNIKLQREQVASFAYRPTACEQTYRVVVLRKDLAVEQGQLRLFDDVRYFFYITNLPAASPAEVVFEANGRCNQENLLEQLRNGARALRMPVDNLVSNWAYMVMASLAWSLKAWFALLLPVRGRWKERRRAEQRQVLTMEFKRFVNAFLRVPCQVVRTGRRIVYRLLAWNPWQEVFLRGVTALRRAAFSPTTTTPGPLLC